MKRLYVFVIGNMLFDDNLVIINSVKNIVVVHDFENWFENRPNEKNVKRDGCVLLGSFNKTFSKNKDISILYRNTDVQLELIELLFDDNRFGLNEIELFTGASSKLVNIMDKWCNG